MRAIVNGVVALLVATLVTACGGGGGGDAGAPPFGDGDGTPTGPVATAIDLLASNVEVVSGGDQVTISAYVKGAGNVALAAAPVSFEATSGVLTSAATETDATGLATVQLSAGADRSNRDVTVTVRSGELAKTITLPVTGTSLKPSGATTVPLSAAVPYSVRVADSRGNPISGVSVSVSSSSNNGLSATTVTTDAQGNAGLTYTAINSGTDTLSFSGLGASASATISISAENFVFVSPSAGAQIVVGSAQAVTVRYLKDGVPQSGKTVVFAATAGSIGASAVTDGEGRATVNVSSNSSSPATVQATLTDGAGASIAQATLPIQFVATTPAKIVLQVQPTALAPNAAGLTTQQAQLVATVTDAAGNPVGGKTVNFNRTEDPSGGDLSQASAVTDGKGQASVQYISGALTTANDGVKLSATVPSHPLVTAGTASLTVNRSALFIALGTGNVIGNLDEQTYKKDWVVYVTDSNGVVVPNVDVTIKVLPAAYATGSLVIVGDHWEWSSNVLFCANEDNGGSEADAVKRKALQYNGALDLGEDANGNSVLDPGNVIAVTTSSGATATTGTVRTDTTGRATVSLVYAESYAPWVKVKLRAEAVVSGTESSKEVIFWVVGSESDFDSDNTPAGVISPFGGADDGCTKVLPY